jgi:hypothetical protein
MRLRRAALPAALASVCLLALPAPSGAAPAISTSIVSTTSLEKVPAQVVHRLTLTAGAQDENVAIEAEGRDLGFGGSAIPDPDGFAKPAPVFQCPGRWTQEHDFRGDSSWMRQLRIPAGTTATVDLTIAADGPAYVDEDLDGTFRLRVNGGPAFLVTSPGPAWRGPTVPEMSLLVLPGADRTTVLTGQALGRTSGLVEIWGIAPRTRRARVLKTVAVGEEGRWSWAGWRPARSGQWELYARYRRSATAPRTGATVCGLLVPVARRAT